MHFLARARPRGFIIVGGGVGPAATASGRRLDGDARAHTDPRSRAPARPRSRRRARTHARTHRTGAHQTRTRRSPTYTPRHTQTQTHTDTQTQTQTQTHARTTHTYTRHTQDTHTHTFSVFLSLSLSLSRARVPSCNRTIMIGVRVAITCLCRLASQCIVYVSIRHPGSASRISTGMVRTAII